MKCIGGDQLLLQGGMHPKLGLDWYVDLFKNLRQIYPGLKLHALGPPEVVHLAKMDSLSYTEVLKRLMKAGLSSLPGAGAEILSTGQEDLITGKVFSKGMAGCNEVSPQAGADHFSDDDVWPYRNPGRADDAPGAHPRGTG